MNTHVSGYRSIHLWLWLTVILLCLVGGGIRLWQNGQREMAQAARWQQHLRMELLAKDALRQVQTLWDSSLRPDGQRQLLSQAEVERALNGGEPFELTRDGDQALTKWTAPGGRTFELTFHGGKWTGFGTISPTRQSVRPTALTPPPFDQFTEKIQRQFAGSFSLGWGTGAWLVALILCIAWKQQRRALAEIMLALTLMCGTAWLTWPYSSITIKGIFSNDMLFWGAVMLVVSAGAISLSRRGVSPPWPECSHCGYNLTGNVSGICPECGTPIEVVI